MGSQTEIEERLAHLERAVDELSETVVAQARQIEILDRRVALLLQREAQRQEEGGAVAVGDERPPHW